MNAINYFNQKEEQLNEMYKNEVKKPVSTCYGITNKCDDGLYILFADYDKIYLHTLLKELDKLQKRFKKQLSPFAILETTESILTSSGTMGSYHVISFGKLPYQRMRYILSYMSVDEDFYKLPKKVPYRANTLRISPKFEWVEHYDKETSDPVGKARVLKEAPKFVCWVGEDIIPEIEVSSAHLKTYKHLINNFKLPFKYVKWKMDNLSNVEYHEYRSLSK